jgi:hypothetical protein
LSLHIIGILLKEKINIIDCKSDLDTAAKKSNRGNRFRENREYVVAFSWDLAQRKNQYNRLQNRF